MLRNPAEPPAEPAGAAPAAEPAAGPADYATRTGFDTRVGAYCVLIEDDRMLLTHLREEVLGLDEWTLPGGGLEPFETPEQAAVRELYEETGLHVELTGLLAVDSFTVPPEKRMLAPDRGRALLSLRIIFTARRVGGALRAEVGGTTDAVAWTPLADVAALPRVELVDVALRARAAARRQARP